MTEAAMNTMISEIWAILRENSAQLAALREQSKETDRKFQETDRKFQETDRKFQENVRELRETKQLMRESARETERRLKETGAYIDRITGDFNNKWGKLMEALVEPSAVHLFQQRKMNITGVVQRLKRHLDHETMEIDLVLLNGDELVVVEVKTTLSQDDVDEFLTDLADFLRFFPEYGGRKIYGAVAALQIPQNVGRYAYRKGLFVLSMSKAGLLQIKNDDKFNPRNFG